MECRMTALTNEMLDQLEAEGYVVLRVSPKHLIARKEGKPTLGYFESALDKVRLAALPIC